MQVVVLFCPMCHGRLLSSDVSIAGNMPQRMAGEQFYCPSCEMLVEPDPNPPMAQAGPFEVNPAPAPENRGRMTKGGTNAGGSQRGDLSDEGATQWYRDPDDTEGSNWKDKD